MKLDFFPYNTDMEREYWAESDNEIEADLQSIPPPLFADSPPRHDEKDVKSVVWWIVLFVSVFQTLHFIPEKAISWLIRFLCVLLKYLAQFSPKGLELGLGLGLGYLH